MRRLVASVTYTLIRSLGSLLMVAGGAALIAVPFLAVPRSQEWANWLAPIESAALAIGVSFLIAGIGALTLLPARRECLRLSGDIGEPPLSSTSIALLGVPAAFAALQLPTLLAWWSHSQNVVDALQADRDPLGFWIVPAMLVWAPPFLASLAGVLCVLAWVSAAALRRALAVRLFQVCVLLQGGIIIGSAFAAPQLRSLAARVLALPGGPDAAVLAPIKAAVERQDLFASALLLRFEWILGANILAATALLYLRVASPTHAAQGQGLSVAIPAASPATPPPTSGSTMPGTTPAFVPALDDYCIRLKSSWITAGLRLGHLDYDIVPTVGGRGERYVFVGSTGVLQRESDGRPLLTVEREGAIALGGGSYRVRDAGSNAVLATFSREGPDWTFIDHVGQPLGRIEETGRRWGYCRYTLLINGTEACRYTWAMAGIGIWTAEMTVEFPDSAPQFDQSLALAFAPVLEARIRRASQRSMS